MQAATERRSHDDDRVPLDALIELTHAEGGEVLEADAVDVSSGGLSLRAAFMPPVGARMQCRFSCPPRGDRVTADCEVVWSVLEGPHAGAFGVRFVALDTRSATLIRHLLEPDNAYVREVLSEIEAPASEPREPVVASLHIDGLGAPIEADVKLDQRDHVLLTQELSFLRLGRGVRVEIEGSEERRGRIASVKLEQVRDDTPALALGVLIDAPGALADAEAGEASAVSRMPSSPTERPLRAATDTWPESPLFGEQPNGEVESDAAAQTVAMKTALPVEDPHEEVSTFEPSGAAAAVAEPTPPTPAVERAQVRAERTPVPDAVDDEVVPTPSVEHGGLTTRFSPAALRELLSAQGLERLRALSEVLLGRARTLWLERVPEGRAWLVELWARLRQWMGSQAKRLEHFRRAQKKRRTTAPPPRTRTQTESRRRSKAAPANARHAGRGRFVLLGLLAFAGVAGGIYSLAPRAAHDDLVLHRPVQPVQPEVAQPAAAAQPAPAESAQAPAVATEPEAEPAAEAEQASADGLSFGSAEVPNGRTYSLRMSGPIERIEGERLRNGFVVRVPGRLSLDRASPIATSHPALSRSLVLNQGDRAELTIEFAPGKKPAYRVQAKGNNLEITVERM